MVYFSWGIMVYCSWRCEDTLLSIHCNTNIVMCVLAVIGHLVSLVSNNITDSRLVLCFTVLSTVNYS